MRYPYKKPNGKFGSAIVENLPYEDIQFVQHDVKVAGRYIDLGTDHDSFFVIEQDGQFLAVWGMYGIVPYLSKSVERLV